MLVCAFFAQPCTRDRGCSAHPAFPAPSVWEKVETFGQTSGNSCREKAKVRLLIECGTVATHSLSSWRKPGPITPNVNCCGTLGPRSRSPQISVVMGPGLRRGDAERGAMNYSATISKRRIPAIDHEAIGRMIRRRL